MAFWKSGNSTFNSSFRCKGGYAYAYTCLKGPCANRNISMSKSKENTKASSKDAVIRLLDTIVASQLFWCSRGRLLSCADQMLSSTVCQSKHQSGECISEASPYS